MEKKSIQETACETFMLAIKPQDLTITQIIPTIKESWNAGFNTADIAWRTAIMQYFKENGIDSKEFVKLLGIISR